MFLRETKLYDDPVHYSRALAMQAEMMSRHGQFELSIQTTIELREIYEVENHSKQILDAYGTDRSAQCIAQSALWNWQLGHINEAEQICDFVLDALMPEMDPQNVNNMFQLLYPVVWVMKSTGRELEAAKVFDEFVVQNFLKRLDERGLTYDRPMHMPIMALLDMAGTDCKTDRLEEYLQWLLIEKNGLFGSELNFIMGSVGRTADSITAEMCLLLAENEPERVERNFLIRKGFELARDAVELTKEKEDSVGMVLAHTQIKPIFEKLDVLHSRLPAERRSRRLSCRW